MEGSVVGTESNNGCICMPLEIKEIFTVNDNCCTHCQKELNNGDVIYGKAFLYGCSANKCEVHYVFCLFHVECGPLFEEKGTHLVGDKGLWVSIPEEKKRYDVLKALNDAYYKVRNHPPLDMCICCGASANNKPMKSCGKCLNVMYCNSECQKNHWQQHKISCKYFAGK